MIQYEASGAWVAPHTMDGCGCGAHHHHECPWCKRITSGTGKVLCYNCARTNYYNEEGKHLPDPIDYGREKREDKGREYELALKEARNV